MIKFVELTPKELKNKVIEIYNKEGKVSAIKFHRNQTARGLKESIDYFNSLNLEKINGN